MRVIRFILFFMFGVILSFYVSAEISVTSALTVVSGVMDTGSGAGFYSYAYGSLYFKSKGNRNVKASLQLDAEVTDRVNIDVSKAFIKVRFPVFRVVLGKTRVSWGEGMFFNAGDVIFEGIELQSDISGNFGDSMRNKTAWLADIYIPIADFSFLEGILLPFPQDNIQTANENLLSIGIMPANFIRYGGRIVTKLAGFKLEAGGLYGNGEGASDANEILAYASVQGHVLLDWAVSGRLPLEIAETEINTGEPALSIGTFGMWNIIGSNSLYIRLEFRLLPDASWEEAETSFPGKDPGYALFIFHDLSMEARNSLTYYLRSLISPIDLSALVFGGLDWNIYQGLHLLIQGLFQIGDSNDVWGWERFGDIAFLAGLRFKY